MRMGQLFELMVAWAKDAPEENFMPPTTQGKREESPLTLSFLHAASGGTAPLACTLWCYLALSSTLLVGAGEEEWS